MQKVMVLFLAIWTALADPRLDHYVDIEGTRLYPDHRIASLWYVQPSPVTLKYRNQTPAYRFELFRYLGRSGTGDRNLFWARGVLSIEIDRKLRVETLTKIKKELQRRNGYPIEISSAPVRSATITLIFADLNVTKKTTGGWSSRPITVGLDATMAQLLWKAVDANQTQIAIITQETIPGVIREGKNWQNRETTIAYTLPVTLDRISHPNLFAKHDLGGRMQRGYTQMDIFDFNFIDNLIPHLYAETVEIAIPSKSRPLIKRVRFERNGTYRKHIRFRLSKRLDTPYRYRILRVYEDGRTLRSKWMEKEGETLLDITQYKERKQDDTP